MLWTMRCPVKCIMKVREFVSKDRYLPAFMRNAMDHEVPCVVYNESVRDGH